MRIDPPLSEVAGWARVGEVGRARPE